MQYPILRYPDPSLGYILYTDASGIGWSGVLTQEHTDDKSKAKNDPICYVSGQFWGSQLNWVVLTKEAYVNYMSQLSSCIELRRTINLRQFDLNWIFYYF